MQRLHAWFMPGLAFFTLSVGLIGLRVHLDRFAYVAMVVGSLIIVAGAVVELIIPGTRWWWSGSHEFDRAIRERIKFGRELIKRPTIDREDFLIWKENTRLMSINYLGTISHPQFTKFDLAAKNLSEEERVTHDPYVVLLIRQMVALSELRRTLRQEPETIVISG
jgi:hypothetical protein